MAAKRHERTRARRSALALLYTSEITDEGATKIAEEGRYLAEDGPLPDYATALVRGVEAHRMAIDKHLAATSENWALARMPIVDRSILRLATFEMMYIDDVPTSVTINEAVELAKKFRVNLEVVSSLERKPGTKVKEVTKVEKTNIAGVAKDTSIARVALIGLQHNPGVAFQVFDLLSKHNINVDVILQSIGREDTKDITFTVHKKDLEESKQILEEHKETLRFDHIETDESIGKVSIVGAGLMSNCGVAARMFEALYEAGINIQMINTSEIRVSVLLDEEDVNRAVRAIHDKFFGEI